MHVYEALARAYNINFLFSTSKFNTIFVFFTDQQIVLILFKYADQKRKKKNAEVPRGASPDPAFLKVHLLLNWAWSLP